MIRRTLCLLWVGAALFALSGCPKPLGTSCTQDSDCRAGSVCHEIGQCVLREDVAAITPEQETVTLQQGAVARVKLAFARKLSNQAFTVEVKGLPPGVSAADVAAGPGVSDAVLELTATESVPTGVSKLTLVAKEDAKVTGEATLVVKGRPGQFDLSVGARGVVVRSIGGLRTQFVALLRAPDGDVFALAEQPSGLVVEKYSERLERRAAFADNGTLLIPGCQWMRSLPAPAVTARRAAFWNMGSDGFLYLSCASKDVTDSWVIYKLDPTTGTHQRGSGGIRFEKTQSVAAMDATADGGFWAVGMFSKGSFASQRATVSEGYVTNVEDGGYVMASSCESVEAVTRDADGGIFVACAYNTARFSSADLARFTPGGAPDTEYLPVVGGTSLSTSRSFTFPFLAGEQVQELAVLSSGLVVGATRTQPYLVSMTETRASVIDWRLDVIAPVANIRALAPSTDGTLWVAGQLVGREPYVAHQQEDGGSVPSFGKRGVLLRPEDAKWPATDWNALLVLNDETLIVAGSALVADEWAGALSRISR